MQKGSATILTFLIIAVLMLQGVTPGAALSDKDACVQQVTNEFNGYKAANAADTTKDGNMVEHGFGCSECTQQYQTCVKTVDTAVTDCARASGWSPTNTCNADREPNYYACANQQTDCCLPGEIENRCGSLTTTEPTSVPNADDLKDDCVDGGNYWLNDQCLDGDDATSYCKGLLGARGYPSSSTSCDRCMKGYAYDGSECAVDQTCPEMQNGYYDPSQDACVCMTGFAPTADGGCQKTDRKYIGINIPSAGKITVKGGGSQTTKISFPASLATAANGPLTLKCSIDSKDDGIKDITFSPPSVLITPGGKAQSMTITTYADDVEEFHGYNAVMRCSGYDSKNLYAGTAPLTIDIVQPDTAFVPEPTTETARQFKELRERQMPDIVTRWKFGEDKAKTLYAKLDQLDDENPEDLKVMATFVSFVDAFNSLANPLDGGVAGNPFAIIDAELFADTLTKTADHRLKLEEAHRKIQEALKQ